VVAPVGEDRIIPSVPTTFVDVTPNRNQSDIGVEIMTGSLFDLHQY